LLLVVNYSSTKCQVVTEEDLLVILYDLMNGELVLLLCSSGDQCMCQISSTSFCSHNVFICSYIYLTLHRG